MGNKHESELTRPYTFDLDDKDISFPDDEKKKEIEEEENNLAIKNFLDLEEKQIRKELKRFENTLPCLLKANSEGKISAFNSCFEDIPLDKIQFREENELSAEEIISNSNETIVDNKEISLGISILMNDVEFKLKTDKDYKYSTSSKSILVKKKIYSSSIKENDIIINDIYYNRLLEIAEDDNSNDEQKAQQLDQIFKETGFYVPLKVYIGGLYNMDCRDMSNEQKRNFFSNLKADLEISSVKSKNSLEMKKTFSRSKTFNMMHQLKIGGDTSKKSFEEWLGTVDLQNSNIIEYAELRRIDYFMDKELKNSLKEPLKLIVDKYQRRKDYFSLIQQIKSKKLEEFYNKRGNFEIGKNSNFNHRIKCDSGESFEIKSGIIKDAKKTVSKIFENIIVGLEIKDISDKVEVAKYSFRNPLLTNEVNITFVSKKNMKFKINIYTIRYPE